MHSFNQTCSRFKFHFQTFKSPQVYIKLSASSSKLAQVDTNKRDAGHKLTQAAETEEQALLDLGQILTEFPVSSMNSGPTRSRKVTIKFH